MNMRLASYIAGAAFLARVVHRPGGRRFAVLDRTTRWRAAARALRAQGLSDRQIGRALGKRAATVSRVLSFGWRL